MSKPKPDDAVGNWLYIWEEEHRCLIPDCTERVAGEIWARNSSNYNTLNAISDLRTESVEGKEFGRLQKIYKTVPVMDYEI